jgi:MFS family permease
MSLFSLEPSWRDPRWGVLAVCLAALALPLSFSAGAVAVPALGDGLQGSPAALAWVTNAFLLSFGSLLLAAGGLADRLGRRRLFLCGTGGFVLATLAVCLAPDLPWLDLARGAQGVAAAAALASGGAALAQRFDGHARTRVFALMGTMFGVGLALGPLLAGMLLQALGWRSVFASGGVLALAAWVLAWRHLDESRGQHVRLDVAGMISFSLMLAALTVALLLLGEHGLRSPAVAGALLATVVLLALFVRIERRQRQPLLDLSLFAQRGFLGVQLLPVATCLGYVVLLVILPLQLLGVQAQSPLQVGLQMLALSAPMLVLPMLAAGWARRVGAARLCTLGLAVCAMGLFLLSQRALQVAPTQWWPALLLIGAGTALPWGLMDGLSVSVVPVQRAGMAAGIFGTVRVAGEGIALAAVTAVLAALVTQRLAPGSTVPLATLGKAGAYLATGSLAQASALLPGLPADILQQASRDALVWLLRGLAALTAGSALLVYALLGRERMPAAVRTDG